MTTGRKVASTEEGGVNGFPLLKDWLVMTPKEILIARFKAGHAGLSKHPGTKTKRYVANVVPPKVCIHLYDRLGFNPDHHLIPET